MVSTLAVEWIEIQKILIVYISVLVSTLAVEWIEISICYPRPSPGRVSTLAVEWIEIVPFFVCIFVQYRLHPRGGVD